MKTILLAVLTAVLFTVGSQADELYKVTFHAPSDAGTLTSTGARAVLWVPDGYVVLADPSCTERLRRSGLDLTLLDPAISEEQLTLDKRPNIANTTGLSVLYQDGSLRLLRVEKGVSLENESLADVTPLLRQPPSITFHLPQKGLPEAFPQIGGLDTLMAKVSQDSLYAYVARLQAFTHRLTGTDSNYAARDWIAAKFASFGYDSVVIDPFTGMQFQPDYSKVPVSSYNVIAYKVGTAFPDQQIIVGAHFDAMPGVPGADDNASGTAAVLEIARILHAFPLPVTFIFIAFDSEESWMWGSYHYADAAAARGDNILLMVNPDMIAHYENYDYSNLYYGEQTGHALLWKTLAETYVNIYASMAGQTASDHLPFQEHGWPVIFVQEGIFSTHYHEPSDSTTYMNFEYMTRMVKATLATVYSTAYAPAGIEVTSLRDVGNGTSLQVQWEASPPDITSHYHVYYMVDYGYPNYSMKDVPSSQTTYVLSGLTQGRWYAVHVTVVDTAGTESIAFTDRHETPYLLPRAPANVVALPIHDGIRVAWHNNNTELDFDHYMITRDGVPLPGVVTDTFFVDDDPALGTAFHDYQVMAVDQTALKSDTVGVSPAYMRTATLDAGRVLAVNRTADWSSFVQDTLTRAFLKEAFSGYNYIYYSDTAALSSNAEDTFNLVDMIDYGLLVIGAEARNGGLGAHRLLDTLSYYLSIGGKAIVFGRYWDSQQPDTFHYSDPADPDHAYYTWLGMDSRVLMPTQLISSTLHSELVGAHSQMTGYPDLDWDSLAAGRHTSPLKASGIPFASYGNLRSPDPEVVYTFRARDPGSYAEGQPIAWRYLGPEYQYVFFEMPLSFIQTPAAITAVRQAARDLGVLGPTGCCIYGRGNANGDPADKVNIADITFLIDYLFVIPIGPAPSCPEESDVNADPEGKTNVSDLTYLLTYMFGIPPGPPPSACPYARVAAYGQ